MVNWKEHGNPFLDFAEELTQQWVSKDFTKDQCQDWLGTGSVGATDAGFCAWMRDEVEITPEEFLNEVYEDDLKILKEQYQEYLVRIKEETVWQLILKLRSKNFSWKEIEEWINVDLNNKDANYIIWLHDIFKMTSLDYSNYLRENNGVSLYEQYQEYLKQKWDNVIESDSKLETEWKKLEISSDWVNKHQENDSESDEEFRFPKKIGEENSSRFNFIPLPPELIRIQNYIDYKCGQCGKEIGIDDSLVWFSDRGQNLDFCSENCRNIWEKWKNVHPSFIPELAKEWKNRGFSYEQCQMWVNLGLEPKELTFATYLRSKSYKLEGKNSSLAEWRHKWRESSENSQEWLNKNYPKEKRDKTKKIYLNETILEGELDLGDFTYKSSNGNGVMVYIHSNVDETRLDLKNLPENSKIIKYISAQEYLNQQYSIKEERKKIEELDISSELVKFGELDLSDFSNLRKLDCSGNKLSSLNLGNCSQLERINCSSNLLTNLDFSNCSQLEEINCNNNLLIGITLSIYNNNLRKLYLNNNNFPEQDLSFLTSYNKLEELDLGNHYRSKKKIDQWIFNKFIGSLDHLNVMKQLKHLRINNTYINETDINKLPNSLERINYSSKITNKGQNKELTENTVQLNYNPQLDVWTWRDLDADFVGEDGNLLKRKWKKIGLNKDQTKEWIKARIKPWEYKFVNYLRDVKKFTLQEFLDSQDKDKESYQEIRERINNFDWCYQCQKPNTSKDWCQPCFVQESERDLGRLNGQELVKKFIEKQRVMNDEDWKKLDLIPYDQFTSIEKIGEGGFSKVYKARWKRENGNSSDIVLKILNNSQNITIDFLTEIASTKLINNNQAASSDYYCVGDGFSSVVKCYGISRETEGNYVIVMHYIRSGNLRQQLKDKTDDNWSLYEKIKKLWFIIDGLGDIHYQKLIHRDLHSGNILGSCIADLGLCKPVGSQKKKGKIFGVLPYVALEVLQGQPYTEKSDIYSFGIIAYELFANAYPYCDYYQKGWNDEKIRKEIENKGLRPDIEEVPIPQLLKNLIKQCWEDNPNQRPKAKEISKIININNWSLRKDTELGQQYLAIKDEYNQWSQNNPPYKIHSNGVIVSKAIDTKDISELLKNSSKTEENFSQLNEIADQIKFIEKEISTLKETLKDELINLVEEFIGTNKKLARNEDDEELMEEAGRLYELLEEKGLSEKEIENLSDWGEKLVKLEQQLEQEQIKTQIEVPTNNN